MLKLIVDELEFFGQKMGGEIKDNSIYIGVSVWNERFFVKMKH